MLIHDFNLLGHGIKKTNPTQTGEVRLLNDMVEARGIEPLSENRFTETSPSAVCLLRFPQQAANKQAACIGIP